ncbi:Gfo/Idh/MocA family protein [Planctomycetes bacterium K23_9]|uniref:Glycosyl hydrolase family 109 protein 1 n=1 Tax=Stieleria marina TaxID=1930275 RepID=A0A517NX93_9BACT|nr:Glycosyl hydrolase family 109 protein 1 precursor [Planctomycetes bacterium K23_9]
MSESSSRRSFIKSVAIGGGALASASSGWADDKPNIQGFEEGKVETAAKPWTPTSNRKIRMGIVGYGVCRFGAQFSLQHHPNVEVVAVSDLFPDRCDALAKACKCEKTYPSLEEMVKDDSIEAIFVATDAPSHCRHVIEVLRHGKHAACAVPAVFGSLEEAGRLFEAVNDSGLIYMLFETSCYHSDVYAMRQIYRAGGFGKLVYSEGEYYHYSLSQIASYKNWRVGLPPQWYPTHSNGYYVGVTGESFTEVSCMAMPSKLEPYQPGKNRYDNPFGTEIALLRTSEGGTARMGVSWDTAGYGGEIGRVRGERGSMIGMKYQGLEKSLPNLQRPSLPPGVKPGGHGGSHGYLGNEFVMSILENRQPLVGIKQALDMTVAGVVAHQSALKGGELLKIPQYTA